MKIHHCSLPIRFTLTFWTFWFPLHLLPLCWLNRIAYTSQLKKFWPSCMPFLARCLNPFFHLTNTDTFFKASVQLLSHVQLTLWTAAHQASWSIANSWSLLKLMPIKSVMPSNQLNLCRPFSSTFCLSQHQGLFQWVSSSNQVAKLLELQLQHQSLQWIFRTNFL